MKGPTSLKLCIYTTTREPILARISDSDERLRAQRDFTSTRTAREEGFKGRNVEPSSLFLDLANSKLYTYFKMPQLIVALSPSQNKRNEDK